MDPLGGRGGSHASPQIQCYAADQREAAGYTLLSSSMLFSNSSLFRLGCHPAYPSPVQFLGVTVIAGDT